MACAICQTRRPRRFCPGVNGEICSICCGTSREVTVDCPFTCEYLQEARRHEKPGQLDPATIPNQDIKVTERFVEQHAALMTAASFSIVRAALDTPGVVDYDVREALDSLVKTYRTLQSGVHYEPMPQNPLAASIHRAVQTGLAEYRKQEQEQAGMVRTRDADVLGMLVFLQRIEYDWNNGRLRGRAFLDRIGNFLYSEAGPAPEEPPASSLIVP